MDKGGKGRGRGAAKVSEDDDSCNGFGNLVSVRREQGFDPRLTPSKGPEEESRSGKIDLKAPMGVFFSRVDNSWKRDLSEDPEGPRYYPNREGRSVLSGHFVNVKTVPLQRPSVVILSKSMAKELDLSEDDTKSETFLRFFSADPRVLDAQGLQAWATPYALSQSGHKVFSNCPYKNGTGYGDGRAASVAEVVVRGKRWELQLKGSGPTPFSRGSDGRAVLRSSIREFLASEAMYALGVPTTRALVLVKARRGSVQRPWYSDELKARGRATGDGDDGSARHHPIIRRLATQVAKSLGIADREAAFEMLVALIDDKPHPLLATLSSEQKTHIKAAGEYYMKAADQFSQNADPDVMEKNTMAITTRVAPSFTRVGHIEVHSRRLDKSGPARRAWRKSASDARDALEAIVRHVIVREFSETDDPKASLAKRVLLLLRESSRRIALLVAHWLRVGYCQGNFNGDNCLIAGRTMDYGPFGFIEKYERLWNMWSGGGPSYAFMNQPSAAAGNFSALTNALLPLLDANEDREEALRIARDFPNTCAASVNDMWRRKMGLETFDPELWRRLENLLESSNVDYTIFWRQLSEIPLHFDDDTGASKSSANDAAALLKTFLTKAFYEPLKPEKEKMWTEWIGGWTRAVKTCDAKPTDISAAMKRTNPKYVPREWMLVEAYTASCKKGDDSLVHRLHSLFASPYAEGSADDVSKYYRKAPRGAAETGGTGFMT